MAAILAESRAARAVAEAQAARYAAAAAAATAAYRGNDSATLTAKGAAPVSETPTAAPRVKVPATKAKAAVTNKSKKPTRATTPVSTATKRSTSTVTNAGPSRRPGRPRSPLLYITEQKHAAPPGPHPDPLGGPCSRCGRIIQVMACRFCPEPHPLIERTQQCVLAHLDTHRMAKYGGKNWDDDGNVVDVFDCPWPACADYVPAWVEAAMEHVLLKHCGITYRKAAERVRGCGCPY